MQMLRHLTCICNITTMSFDLKLQPVAKLLRHSHKKNDLSFFILGDPEADSGDEEKSKWAEKYMA